MCNKAFKVMHPKDTVFQALRLFEIDAYHCHHQITNTKRN